MSARPPSTTVSLRRLRWRARAPRIALYSAVAILCLAGLRAALSGPVAISQPVRHQGVFDHGGAAFAEAFARAYLAADPREPEVRERRLAAYLADELEPDGGRASGRAGPRAVEWTAVVSQERRAGRLIVTVAAAMEDGRLVHLAVPVARDRRGFLAVPAYPALVGAPASNPRIASRHEREVEDLQLRAVAERAITNYLAGERRDLLADLAADAVVSLPPEPLRVRASDAVEWAGRGIVAVQIEAEDREGAVWTLRYELGVVRRERWYVRSLAVDPRARGGS